MTNSSDLRKSLVTSLAYQSLAIENEVYNTTKRFFPQVSRSPYFEDPITGKLREIDICAQVRFRKFKKDPIFCNFNLFIECKTNRGFNIIADGESKDHETYLYDCEIWMGDDANERFQRSREVLSRTSLGKSQIEDCLAALFDIFYPNESKKTGVVVPQMFEKIKSFSSFRETNIKDEKGLENSVLWRAFLSLSSAQKALEKDINRNYELSLLNYGDYKTNKKLGMAGWTLNTAVNIDARNSYLVQKVVVIDSPLWTTSENGIEKIDYFRLLRSRIDSVYIDFVDIVNRSYFPEYIQAVHSHYFEEQKRIKTLGRVKIR